MNFRYGGGPMNTNFYSHGYNIPKQSQTHNERFDQSHGSIGHINSYLANETMSRDEYEEKFYGYVEDPQNANSNRFSGGMNQTKYSNIYNRRPEKKKNTFKPYLAHKIATIDIDVTLPNDLRKLFESSKCNLCQAELSSNVMAKVHYNSHAHEKKIRKWLIDYSEKTGEPLHERAKNPVKKKEEEHDPKYFHCSICDIPLTGKLHAESHYMGKSHIKAAMGNSAPAKRKVTASSSLTCGICEVAVTSQQQLDDHFVGQKHIKKMRSVEGGHVGISLPGPQDKNPDELPVQFGMFCDVCCISFNSKLQYTQHYESKKHERKLLLKQAEEAKREGEIKQADSDPAESEK